MAWWRKKVVSPARRAWAAVSTRVRARNTGGAGGGSILKLHEDVQTCGYRDVQVMFDILTSELEASAQRPAAKHHQRKRPPSPSSPWPRYPSSSMIAAAQ
ncbi:uncharacterized protein [Zea mays]|uniref:OSJNBa0041A02.21-like protein n=1 Tax=Zea mays TaxID=4577 RepID=A0A1D6E0G7_MAIZE|nr:uncharacterized protein LOC103645981 [Zea mays]ONM14230.1 OSJNBa0041A02.21-like protein [Zea mays]|eukprot:XP_008668937.1 uncharacterized protein LOC103645981 [Zea mays]